MNEVTVHLDRAAAKAALMQIDAPADIQFLQFKVGAAMFAMSVRLVVEVDVFPHRMPDRVIHRTDPAPRCRK